jgi:hypothetical protein
MLALLGFLALDLIQPCSAFVYAVKLNALRDLRRLMNLLVRNAKKAGLVADVGNQLVPRPYRKSFYG